MGETLLRSRGVFIMLEGRLSHGGDYIMWHRRPWLNHGTHVEPLNAWWILVFDCMLNYWLHVEPLNVCWLLNHWIIFCCLLRISLQLQKNEMLRSPARAPHPPPILRYLKHLKRIKYWYKNAHIWNTSANLHNIKIPPDWKIVRSYFNTIKTFTNRS